MFLFPFLFQVLSYKMIRRAPSANMAAVYLVGFGIEN